MNNSLTFRGREVTNHRYAWQRVMGWMLMPYPPPYVNEECPDQCGTEHECPHHETFTCPETGTEYGWCESSYDFKPVRTRWGWNRSFSIGPDGDQRCEDCYHETWGWCEECDTEGYRDDMRWHENGEMYLCPSCYEQQPPEGRGMEGTNEPVQHCHKCNTPNVHLAMLPETFHCDCEAHALLHQGQPIVLAHPLPDSVEHYVAMGVAA